MSKKKHLTGKIITQRIERNNLLFALCRTPRKGHRYIY
ncbi:IS1 family transposase [Serratia plymuthica]